MINVDDFIKQNNPNRSILARFHDDIAKLRAAKMSYQKIQEYLALNGIKTHMNNVRGYCQRHIENKVIFTTDQPSDLKKPKKNVSSASKSAKSSKTSSTKTSSRNATTRTVAKKIAKKPAIKQSPNKKTNIKNIEPDKQTSLF